MSNTNKKSLLKNINFSKFKLKISKFDLTLIFITLLIQSILAGASFYKGIYHFHASFIKNNYIQILIIVFISVGIFYLSYRDYVKKTPNLSIVLTFLFLTVILFFNILGVNSVVEFLARRSVFTSGDYVFAYMFMIMAGAVIARYDFPITTTFKEFYSTAMTHFYKNLGFFIALALIVAIIGFLNMTFVYAIGYLLIIDSIYLIKAVLANIRK